MTDLEEVRELNRELGERIYVEARKDPSSPYAGKYVGIANGQVVVITDDREGLYYRLQEIEPDNRRVFWVDTNRDPDKIEYIWRF